MENNKIELVGKVKKSFKFMYSSYGEDFYSLVVDTERTSGVCDTINLICSDRIINVDDDITDCCISVVGTVRTRNDDGHLIISVFVDELDVLDIEEIDSENYVELTGYICKNGEARMTPLGRKICDTMVAVNHYSGRSFYIPVVSWGRNASYVSSLPIGTKIGLCGRLQSRNYIKNEEQRTAFEISVQKVELEN